MNEYHGTICDGISNGYTHKEISDEIQNLSGQDRGFSERSVRLYCKENGLTKRGNVDDQTLTLHVSNAVNQVGPTYGRKMMTGYLSSKGIKAAERRVGKVLKDVNAPYNLARQRGARNLNPIPYTAEYFGHKIHMDQNEKLVMFGVVHVVAIDGYSSKIVSYATMAVKNNLVIYEDVYRKAVIENGTWDCVRVDHGREFYLSLYMQERNLEFRTNTDRDPYRQTKSTMNYKVERVWVEVNNRVNYPIKMALVDLHDRDVIDMDDNITRYSVSNLCQQICEIGMKQTVDAWNSHRIPGKGVPNVLAKDNSHCFQVEPDIFPHSITAAEWYAQDTGAQLQQFGSFATFPFPNNASHGACAGEFNNIDLTEMFGDIVNNDFTSFQQLLLQQIDRCRHYCQ